MLPRRPKQIFLSRWSALYWAGGVIFFAVTTIGFADRSTPPDNSTAAANQTQQSEDPPTDAMGQPITKQDADALKKLLN